VNECIDRFLTYLKSQGAKENTIKTYVRFVSRLLTLYPKPTLDDVLKFLSEYSSCAPLTQATCAYALRTFFEANPQLGVDYKLIPLPSRVEAKVKVTTIPESEIRKMAESVDVKTGAIIALMYEVGLRVSEVGKLKCGDLDLKNWNIYVRRSKGSVSSLLPIVSDWVKEILLKYMEIRKPQSPDEPLFPGYDGKGLSFTRVSTIVKSVLERFGYGNARPHDIRHSRATNLLNAGIDVVTVSHILGHKSLSSTSRYLHLVTEDIRRKLLSIKS
jgi:site-specific recombinase XerD